MLENMLPGTWRIRGAHANMRLNFRENHTWNLGGTSSPDMSGTWNTTHEGVDLHVTQLSSAAAPGWAIAVAGLAVSLSLGTAALILPAAMAGYAASSSLREQNPGALGVFTQGDVRKQRAVAHYRLVSYAYDQVVLRNPYHRDGYDYSTTLTLDRVR